MGVVRIHICSCLGRHARMASWFHFPISLTGRYRKNYDNTTILVIYFVGDRDPTCPSWFEVLCIRVRESCGDGVSCALPQTLNSFPEQ